MDRIKEDFLRADLHTDSNIFVLLVICHGDDEENLMDKDGNIGWNTMALASELSTVQSLRGKPKILIIQACRGSEYAYAFGENYESFNWNLIRVFVAKLFMRS